MSFISPRFVLQTLADRSDAARIASVMGCATDVAVRSRRPARYEAETPWSRAEESSLAFHGM